MKKFSLLTLCVCSMLALTSCFNDDDEKSETTVTRNYTQCFNSVYDNTSGEIVLTPQPKYTIKIVYKGDGSITGQVSMTNVSLGIDVPYTNFDLPELKFKITGNSAPEIEATDVIPTNISGTTPVHFTKFRLTVLDRVLKNENTQQTEMYSAYGISFTVNNRYNVTVYPTNGYYFGTTATTAADGSVFSSMAPRYAIVLDPVSKKARIDITGAQFVASMPAMNMSFADIPFTTGVSTLSMVSEALTPTINSTPFPAFPISDLKCTLNPASGTGLLDFHCVASKMGDYDVSVKLQEEPILQPKEGGE